MPLLVLKSPVLLFNLYLQYNQRVADGDSEDDNFVAKPNSRKQRHKRKATTNLSISMPRATTAKRTRERAYSSLPYQPWLTHCAAPLQTTFAPEPLALSSKTAERATRIRFRRTICTIQPYTAYPSFNEDAALESGLLQDSPLALPPADQGRTKDVYRVSASRHGNQAYGLITAGSLSSKTRSTSLSGCTISAKVARTSR